MKRRARALLAGALGALVTASGFVAGQESKTPSASIESRLEVQVVDPSGAVIPTAGITIQNGEGYVLHGKTDAAGVFSIPHVAAGEYNVMVECGGFVRKNTTVSVQGPAAVLLQLEVTHGVIDNGVDSAVEPLTSNAIPEVLALPDLNGNFRGSVAAKRAGRDLILERGTVDFTVLDPSGAEVARALVSVLDGKKKVVKGRTDDHGSLSISVPKGTHFFVVKSAGFTTYKGTISQGADEHIHVEVKLKLFNSGPVTSVD